MLARRGQDNTVSQDLGGLDRQCRYRRLDYIDCKLLVHPCQAKAVANSDIETAVLTLPPLFAFVGQLWRFTKLQRGACSVPELGQREGNTQL